MTHRNDYLHRPMRFCSRYVQIGWVVAILLMAGGQLAHAYMDLTCSKDHVSESQQSPAPGDDCPVGHCCVHSHLQIKMAAVDSAGDMIPDTSACSFPSREEMALDGPTREIDYPPQLS